MAMVMRYVSFSYMLVGLNAINPIERGYNRKG